MLFCTLQGGGWVTLRANAARPCTSIVYEFEFSISLRLEQVISTTSQTHLELLPLQILFKDLNQLRRLRYARFLKQADR